MLLPKSGFCTVLSVARNVDAWQSFGQCEVNDAA